MTSRRSIEDASNFRSQEGKGQTGCLLFLLLLAVFILGTIKVWPDYYAYRSLETDIKTEVSRAGANFLDDETVRNNILLLGRRNEVQLGRENVKVERFAGQIHVHVQYTVPIDLMFYTWNMNCDIKASSFIGRL